MIIFGFDLDETLIHTNHRIDQMNLYRSITGYITNNKMRQLLIDVAPHYWTFILTARPPSCLEQIKKMFRVNEVYCVSDEIKDKNQLNTILSNTEEFNSRNADVKIRFLNKMQRTSRDGDVIFYFDDLCTYFQKYILNIQQGIFILPPLDDGIKGTGV